MKRNFTTTILIVFAFVFIGLSIQTMNAQTPNWAWAKTSGGYFNDEGRCVATDDSGNVYVTGYFNSQTLTIGSHILTNGGGFGTYDLFIAKYNPSGNVMWAVRAGGNGDDEPNGIAIDASGNLYIAGSFSSSSIVFGTSTLTNAATFSSVFIAKYDRNGNALFGKGFSNGSVSTFSTAQSIALDHSGNIFITGAFSGTDITFDTIQLSNTGTNFKIFIAKFSPTGNVIWAKAPGGSGGDLSYSVATDVAGDAFITGYFASATATFGTTVLTNAGQSNVFIAKYSPTGTVLWAYSAGGTHTDWSKSICTDASGNAIITGYFSSTSISFGSNTLTSIGQTNMFLVKYSSTGTVTWAKSAGIAGSSIEGSSVTSDNAGNLYVLGQFNGATATFGSSTLTNDSTGTWDIYVAKYNTSGTVQWAKSAAGKWDDWPTSIHADAGGNLYMTGYYPSPSINFGSIGLTNVDSPQGGQPDFFLAKINSTTGIEELSNTKQPVIVYPNPARTILNIHHSNPSPNQQLIITDLLGTEVYKEMLTGIDNTISISTWSAGVYFYEVRGSGLQIPTSLRGKFVVQK